MAVTTGRVFGTTWTGAVVCTRVGTSQSSSEVLFIEIRGGDSAMVSDYKKAMSHTLANAQVSGIRVSASHADDGAEITAISIPAYDISPLGPAVRGDFYGISGNAIPADASMVFETPTTTVTVTPELRRPHWVFISDLPAAVPLGRLTVRLQAVGWTSDAVPIDVTAGARSRVRTIYSGAPKADPYTIAFVANPGIEAETGGTVSADPVLTNRAGYHAALSQCLRNFLTVTEDLLRRSDRDRGIRIVSIFDETRTAVTATSLAHEVAPNIMETRRDRLKSFLAGYGVTADVVFVLHGSTTHDRASAWFTTDDAARAGVSVTFDGTTRTHGRFASIPGSAAVPISFDTTGLTPLHEFGHAASDFGNGMVIDLYVDGTRTGFVVNKKMRALATDAIPTNFATYAGTTVTSDQARDGVGYPSTWTSYHPQLIDATRPNLMDNYWLAAQPQQCRLDNLTNNFMNDRLSAKLGR
jgi:hypothetical protein